MVRPPSGEALLKWASLAVPGMAAGLAWRVTEGLPLLNRVVSGIAIGLVLYAVFHVVIRGLGGNRP